MLYGQERDVIARASFSTYRPDDLARLGLQIHLNTNNKKTRYVGNPNVYPEIIVWRPDSSGSNTGQAVIVEEVETNSSLAIPRINDWRIIASLSGVRFNLIVPTDQVQRVRQIISSNNIQGNIVIQGWNYDTETGRYVFN